jgi:hypothetical protein
MDQNYQFEIEEWDPCEEIQRLIENNPWAWQSIGALSGLGGGVLCPVLGTLLIASTHFITSEGVVSSLNVLIIVCFALIIPLLLFGAHCLDLLERQADQGSVVEEQQPDGIVTASVGLHEAEPDKRYFKPTAACVAFLCLFVLPASGNAQQTIFNVPTTDVLERGKVYFELDISAKPNEPRFSSFVPRVVVGADKRIEVGVNLTRNIQPGPDITALVPTLKYKFYDGGNNGYAMVVGNNLIIPIRNRSYDLGNYFYVNGSKSYNKTRLTVGGYHFSSNVVAPNAHRAGGQFGFEQTISPSFTIAGDWITGRHASGYVTPGVIFKPHPRVTGYAGYSLGNSNLQKGNHFLLLESGFTLN